MKQSFQKFRLLVAILLTTLFTAFLSGCGDDSDPTKPAKVEMNSTAFKFSVIPSSITPVSASFKKDEEEEEYYVHKIEIYMSEDEEFLESVIDQITKVVDIEIFNDKLFRVDLELLYRDEDLTGLTPGTTYYMYGVARGYGVFDMHNYTDYEVRVSPRMSFRTEDVNLYVDMGGSVIWCGVNYLEDRIAYDDSQFLSQTLIGPRLVNPQNEVIPGNWRYPTDEEIRELVDNCTVTLIDCSPSQRIVRLTSKDGTNLYVPFTFKYGYSTSPNKSTGYYKLNLFPSDKLNGLLIEYKYMAGKDYGNNLGTFSITSQRYTEYSPFYYWSETLVNGHTASGVERRGVRFVCDK